VIACEYMPPPNDSGYSREIDYIDAVGEEVRRRSEEIAIELEKVFGQYMVAATAKVLSFDGISADYLARVFVEHPKSLKPFLALAGIAGRAIERDLGIKNLDTYDPRLTQEQSLEVARYLLELVPKKVSLDALVELDRVEYLDKAKRMWKGAWEKKITQALVNETGCGFEKRTIVVDEEEFEIDAAYPSTGTIEYAVDVKRVEARKDYQKRSDEIVNKAKKLKMIFPQAKFAAVFYYPFEQSDIISRVRSENVDLVLFGNDSGASIAAVAKDMAKAFGIRSSS
jgi:hypothetical protein